MLPVNTNNTECKKMFALCLLTKNAKLVGDWTY